MIAKTESTETRTAHGKTLDAPIKYSFSWTAYENTQELIDAKDELSYEQQVKVRNAERMAKSRSAAYAKALADAGFVKPTAENDPQVALRDLFKTLIAATDPKTGQKRFTEEKAREVASMTLGTEWEE